MTDAILWASLESLTATIDGLRWPEPSYFYLERVSDLWLSEAQRQDGMRFGKLKPERDLTLDFDAWERGRIFCETFELRWEKMDDQFQAVYGGLPVELAGFKQAEEMSLDAANILRQERAYFLWGSRVSDDQLATVGAEARPDSQVFIEMRVPRLLRYPVSAETRRVRLRICEYIDREKNEVVYARFQGLDEVTV